MVSTVAVVAYTTPFVFTWFCFLVLLVEHMIHRFNIKFQALCLRITVAFPFLSTINYINLFVSQEVFVWINIVTGVAEGLLLLEFLALLVGWFWSRGGNIYEAFMEAPQTSRRCWWRCLGSCGKAFNDGQEALNNLVVQVLQYGIVKPTTDLIEAIVYTVRPDAAVQSQRALQAIDIVSVVLALRALLICYVVLRRRKDPKTKRSYFVGLSVLYKFLLIKLLFAFIVLNNLILSVLAAFDALETPSWLCVTENATWVEEEDCTGVFKSFIFLVEGAIASIVALHFFRSQALCYPEIFGNFENYPGPPEEDRSLCALLQKTCTFWDLDTYFYPQGIAKEQLPGGQTEVVKNNDKAGKHEDYAATPAKANSAKISKA